MIRSVTSKVWNRSKYVIKLAVAGLVAMGMAALVGIDFNNTMMLIFFSMLMVQSTIGETLSQIRPLIGWSFLGIGVGITVVMVFEPLISRYPWTMWPVVGLLVVYGAFTLPIHRQARLNFITALLVLMVGHATSSPVQVALWRGLTLVIAVAISIPVSYLIFPVRSTHLMRDACYDIVGKGSELLSTIFKALLDPKQPWNEYERTVQVRELRDEVVNLGKLMDDARKEGMQMRHNKVRRIFITLYRIVHYLFSLTRLINELRGNPLLAATSEGFIHTAEKLQQLLGLWEAQLVDPPARLQMPDVEASLKEIEDVLEDRRKEGKYAPLRHTSAFFSLLHTVGSFAHDLEDGIQELHQLQTEE